MQVIQAWKNFTIFHLWHSSPLPFSSVACSWTYVQLHKKLLLGRIWRTLTYLAVCLHFFSVKLQFNGICRKLTYLCTLSSRRNVNYVSHNTVSGRVKNKENLVDKHTFWTKMKFTENLNPRKLQICDIYCLKSHVRRNTEFWIFGRNGGRSEKSWAWTFFGEEYVSSR